MASSGREELSTPISNLHEWISRPRLVCWGFRIVAVHNSCDIYQNLRNSSSISFWVYPINTSKADPDVAMIEAAPKTTTATVNKFSNIHLVANRECIQLALEELSRLIRWKRCYIRRRTTITAYSIYCKRNIMVKTSCVCWKSSFWNRRYCL